MILSEKSSLPVVEARDDFSFTENGSCSLSDEEILAVSTPRRGRSISYLELTTSHNETSLLSDTSLQRMRSLSQSINDLKILREKQQERQHDKGDLLNDDFLKEHARKLKDVRDRIKMLEAKYQSPRSKLHLSSLQRNGKQSGLNQRNESLVLSESEEKSGQEETDGYSGSMQGQNGITEARPKDSRSQARKSKPLTWASEDFKSECNSLSSFGSSTQRMMEIIPENFDWNRNRCYGDGATTTHHFKPTQNSRSNPTTHATKWRSMPNLGTRECTLTENRTFIYGEAIPLDPTVKQHHTKFTRKTGFYTVNESPGKYSTNSRSKKQKIRDFFHRKSASNSKKTSQKLVSSPKDGIALGKVARCHPNIENAYIVELCRPDKGTFGFNIRKGHGERQDGMFVSKIADKKAEKFLAGLLRVGDEILKINSTNVREESLMFVQKLIKNADKLELVILPHSAQEQ